MKRKLVIIFTVVITIVGCFILSVNADEIYSPESTGITEDAVYIRNFRKGFFIYKEEDSNDIRLASDRSYSEDYMLYEWIIRNEGNDQFSIRYYDNPSLVLSVDDNDNVFLITAPTVLTNNCKWTITSTNTEDGYSFITSSYNGKKLFGYDNESLTVASELEAGFREYPEAFYWKISNSISDEYVSLTSFGVQYSDWMEVGSTQNITITLTPSDAEFSSQIPGHFVFTSENTDVVTVSRDGKITAKSEGYTCIIVKHKSSARAHRLPIVVGQILENGDYYLSNRSTGGFCDNTASIATGISLIDAEWNMSTQQQWAFTYLENGYYSILSRFSGLYLAATNATLNNNIIRQIFISDPTNIPDNAQWRIIRSTQGAYYLISKGSGSSNYALNCREPIVNFTPTTLSLIQTIYVDDFSYLDEWYITNVNDILTPAIPIMGLEDNKEYLILNVKSGKFMYQGNPSNTADNMQVYTSEQYTDKNSWVLKIRSSSSGMCSLNKIVGSTSYKLNCNNSTVQLSVGGTYLKIQRVNIKPYEGTYIVMYGTKYLSQDLTTGQIKLTNQFNETCIWSISNYNRDDVHYFFFTGDAETREDVFSLLREVTYNCIPHDDACAYDGYVALKDDQTDIFIFRGHANPGLLGFNGTRLTIFGEATVSDVSNSESNHSMITYQENELASVQMACFLGCHSGGIVENGTLQDVAFDKGAHFAIATFDTVYSHNSDYFLKRFCINLNKGYNVETAIWMAQYEVDQQNPDYLVTLPSYDMRTKCYPVIYTGDVYQRINNIQTE